MEEKVEYERAQPQTDAKRTAKKKTPAASNNGVTKLIKANADLSVKFRVTVIITALPKPLLLSKYL
jgi:hypothetical protein